MLSHQVFKSEFEDWESLESGIEELSNTTEIGEAFEQFVEFYFNNKAQYYGIEKIYRLKDVPTKILSEHDLESTDVGVDGIIIYKNSKVAGYQAKFRTGRTKPSYSELTKFWAEGRNLDYHITIANCYELTTYAGKNVKHIPVLVGEFEDLKPSFFSNLHAIAKGEGKKNIKKHEPYDFQDEIIESVVSKFEKYDKGKLIAACGTGKTLTALWIAEKLDIETVLFIAPSLSLIKQTLAEWSEQARKSFEYLCICSDQSVTDDRIKDNGDIKISEFDIPVTTDYEEISRFLSRTVISERKIVFSTYHSLDVLAKTLEEKDFEFGLTIFDEAHRTAGIKSGSSFTLALNDEVISSNKRLFMTATPRLVKPWIKEKVEEEDLEVFSMDDEESYGPEFYDFNFGRAIQEEVISDYKILVLAFKERDIADLIKKDEEVSFKGSKEKVKSTFKNLFLQVLLSKAYQKYGISKVISFHSTIDNAKLLVDGSDGRSTFKEILNLITDLEHASDLYTNHINGSLSAGVRKKILDEFKDSKLGLISNSRCLTEGIDVPIIDSIYFPDPKRSIIDIVQACGRALRTGNNGKKKYAYFIVPVVIEDEEFDESYFENDKFEMVFNLIQALRDQDQRLEDWVDKLNKSIVSGNSPRVNVTPEPPLVIDGSREIDLQRFQENLLLKINEVNANPVVKNFKKVKKKKGSRKATVERKLKTVVDYNLGTLKENEIDPVVGKFENKNVVKDKEELYIINESGNISHNTISHTKRLGLISKEKSDKYSLTEIGKAYYDKEISYSDLVQRQLLRYYQIINEMKTERTLFPYRFFSKVLMEINSISQFEFTFSIYIANKTDDQALEVAVRSINYLRDSFPRIDLVNKSNQELILDNLNSFFNTDFRVKDIWKKRTTVYNQYIYFRDHLTRLPYFHKDDSRICVTPEQEYDLYKKLKSEEFLESIDSKEKLLEYYISYDR